MRPWLFLGSAIIAEVVGTSFLKESAGFTRVIPTVASLAAYAVAFFGLSRAIIDIELGIAYAIWAGVGTALIVLVGWVVFRQSLDWPALVGVLLIVGGVVVINAFSGLEA
ncbi:MAG: multidrug efflux SMR transporter [Acidimicrobiia bacterium]|nr:multidrug efflux SMR transporter [Acidimicrobiia bacterium]